MGHGTSSSVGMAVFSLLPVSGGTVKGVPGLRKGLRLITH